jgi:hypothetical protein
MQALANDVQFNKCTFLKPKIHTKNLLKTPWWENKDVALYKEEKISFSEGVQQIEPSMSSEVLKIHASINELCAIW